MTGRWVYPVDPECPQVVSFRDSLYNDPMSKGAPLDEISEAWERKHRINCVRCKLYSVENIDVEYGID